MTNYQWELTRNDDYGLYLKIRFFADDPYMQELGVLQWEAAYPDGPEDPDTENEWKWPRFDAQPLTNRGQVDELAKIVRHLMSLGHRGDSIHKINPDDVITWLQHKRNTVRVIRDPRIAKHVPFNELVNPDYEAYNDDPEAAGYKYANATVLARDEDDARFKLTQKFGEQIAKGYNITDIFADWIKAGQPVKLKNRWSDAKPDDRSVAELMQLPTYRPPLEPEKTEEEISDAFFSQADTEDAQVDLNEVLD